ncbi:MAG: T9SS type A sorting domain-containing protein [Saprospiraceae bacterium]|nr:T9SS type A sorting domain-containing protein [Saprospiraceae bacterium]
MVFFAYADLPLVLTDLQADGQTSYEFVVLDQENHDCRNYIVLGVVDCYCLWSDINVAEGDCTSDSTYVIEVDFAPGNVETFSLYTGDQKLGDFAFGDLPLRLTDFPAGGGAIDELWICATQTNCCIKYELESPLCARDECSIRDIEAYPLDCEDGQYKVKLDFEYDGNQSDYFIVKHEGEYVGEYRYDELPVKVGPFQAIDSSSLILEICDSELHGCHASVEVMPPACKCDLGEIKVEVGECTSDSTYQVILNPQIEGSFDFYVNGHFCGTFNSEQLPLTFDDFPASGNTYDYIKICALDSNYCCAEQKIESPVCARNTCQWGEIKYEITECDSNQEFYVKIWMDTMGDPSGTFIIQRNNDLMEFSYSNLPVKIGPFPGGDDFYKFKIYDSVQNDCREEITVGRVVCTQQCSLSFQQVDIVECTEDDGYVLVIDSLEGSFNAFDVYFGEHYLGFYKKEKLPLRLKVPDVNKNDSLVTDSVVVRICVSDNTTCCFTKVLALPDCHEQVCDIGEIQLDTFECRNDSFWVNVDFESLVEDSSFYKLVINGDIYQEFTPQDLPLHVGPFLASDKKYAFLIKSLLHPDCATEIDFTGVECPGTQIASDQRLLILESSNYTNYVRVPDFIAERSVFQLVDLSGRVLYQMEFSSHTHRALIQLPVDVAGMYIVKIKSYSGESHLSKIIIP